MQEDKYNLILYIINMYLPVILFIFTTGTKLYNCPWQRDSCRHNANWTPELHPSVKYLNASQTVNLLKFTFTKHKKVNIFLFFPCKIVLLHVTCSSCFTWIFFNVCETNAHTHLRLQRSHRTSLMHILYIPLICILLCLFHITVVREAECHALSTPLFPEGDEPGLRDLSHDGGQMLLVAWRGGFTVSVRAVTAINQGLTLEETKTLSQLKGDVDGNAKRAKSTAVLLLVLCRKIKH